MFAVGQRVRYFGPQSPHAFYSECFVVLNVVDRDVHVSDGNGNSYSIPSGMLKTFSEYCICDACLSAKPPFQPKREPGLVV